MANNQIALLAQTPVFDTPFESQGKALQLRQMMNQGQVQDMDMQQRRQAIADDQQTRDISSRFGDPGQRIAELYKVNPKAAMAMQTFQQGVDKSAADIGQIKANTQKTQSDVINQKMTRGKDMLNTVNDPESAARWVQGMFSDPDLAQVFAQGGDTVEQAIKRIPSDPQEFAKWRQASQLGAEKLISMTTPDANAQLSAQTQRDNNAISNATTQRGQNMTAGTAAAGREQSATQHKATIDLQREKLSSPGRGGPMSVTLQKELLESDDAAQSSKAVVNTLTEALKINKDAYSGYGAKGRAVLASNMPWQSAGADATINLDNMMTGQALESLKTVFGGMPTEGERKILLDMQASADKTPKQREDIMTRAISAAKRRGDYAQQKAQSIRGGAYLSQGMPEAAADPLDSLLDKYK